MAGFLRSGKGWKDRFQKTEKNRVNHPFPVFGHNEKGGYSYTEF
jgi:hypothetical protein